MWQKKSVKEKKEQITYIRAEFIRRRSKANLDAVKLKNIISTYDTERWLDNYIIIYMKSNFNKCSNFKKISLISHVSKY